MTDHMMNQAMECDPGGPLAMPKMPTPNRKPRKKVHATRDTPTHEVGSIPDRCGPCRDALRADKSRERASKLVLRCSKKRWCTRLDERLAAEANAREKGLVQLTLSTTILHPKKGHQFIDKRVGVFYRTTPRDNGLLIHYCPWCGADLYKLFNVRADKKPRAKHEAGYRVEQEDAR